MEKINFILFLQIYPILFNLSQFYLSERILNFIRIIYQPCPPQMIEIGLSSGRECPPPVILIKVLKIYFDLLRVEQW